MNVILYKYLFHDLSKWNPAKNITDLLMVSIDDANSSLQTILFSSFLFKLVKESLPLFTKNKMISADAENKKFITKFKETLVLLSI